MLIRAKVTVDAPRDRIFESKGVLMITVREPAKDDRANQRVRRIVANHYDVLTHNVRIISGHHKPTKVLLIKDLTKKK